MFKFLVFCCVVAASFAEPGLLSPLRIGVSPTLISSAPTVGVVRSAPIALGTIRAPLVLGSGLVSNGLISGGLVSNGIVNGGLVSGKLLTNGLIH